jgi:outer membrane assembly lipoprotein YfiO
MNLRATVIGVALALGACGTPFRVKDFPTPLALYRAGIAEYEKGNWEHAITALDQVTILLPPRDTLLPRAHFVLGRAYEKNKSFLLSAATFKRLYEDFPDDSLADDALLAMADAESKAWRGPEFSSEHAELALDAYSLLQRQFPASPLVKRAQEGEARMNEGLARKDLNNGLFYIRRHAWDSALIPLKDAATLYPGTAASREAMVKMVEVYRNPKMKYFEDAKDLCKTLRASYGADPAVIKACAGIPADTTRQ